VYKRQTLILFFIAVSLISCSKYEDGPGISFRSAEKRLSGKWKVSQLLYNEKDITVAFYAPQLDLYPFNIYSDWSKSYFISITHPDGSIVAKSLLTLNKKKTVITFGMAAEPVRETTAKEIFTIIPPLSLENNWDILRLKNDELWIRTGFETNNYELHFILLSDFNDY
jgi:hypothetical protein